MGRIIRTAAGCFLLFACHHFRILCISRYHCNMLVRRVPQAYHLILWYRKILPWCCLVSCCLPATGIVSAAYIHSCCYLLFPICGWISVHPLLRGTGLVSDIDSAMRSLKKSQAVLVLDHMCTFNECENGDELTNLAIKQALLSGSEVACRLYDTLQQAKALCPKRLKN